jgi:hypothetical protein
MARYEIPLDLSHNTAAAKRDASHAAERIELYLRDLRKKPPAPSVKRRMMSQLAAERPAKAR